MSGLELYGMHCRTKLTSEAHGIYRKKVGLELLKGWITELLVTFVYTMVFSFI